MAVFHLAGGVYDGIITESGSQTGSQMHFVSLHKVRQTVAERASARQRKRETQIERENCASEDSLGLKWSN